VFSTKDRRPTIPAERMVELFAYLGGIARSEGYSLIAAGGTANHVHLLIILPASISLANAVQKLKGSSSRWMGRGFSWQEGYGALSVSASQVPVVKKYIRNQEEHHTKRNFEEEFVALLRTHGIEYDERYVFG
jgi:REP element-mobilizing transposase RayT